MNGKDKAYWLADKIPACGDYAREASVLLRQQADEIERLRNALRLAADEPNIDRARKIADTVLLAQLPSTDGLGLDGQERKEK